MGVRKELKNVGATLQKIKADM